MPLLQGQERLGHMHGETRARMAAGVVQKFVHKFAELLMAPEDFDLFGDIGVGVQDNLKALLNFTHGSIQLKITPPRCSEPILMSL